MTHPWTTNALWQQRKLSPNGGGGAPTQPRLERRRPTPIRPANPALWAPQRAEYAPCTAHKVGRAA